MQTQVIRHKTQVKCNNYSVRNNISIEKIQIAFLISSFLNVFHRETQSFFLIFFTTDYTDNY
jgi:hypothetical protein